MQTNKGSLSIDTPIWLTTLVILLMAARGLVFLFENFFPAKIVGITWHDVSQIDLKGRSDQPKLVLYAFTTNWCEPYKTLEKTAFLDKDLVKTVNEKFLPVQILEQERKKGESPDKLVEAMQEKYSINLYPTFIVTLPDGKEIDRRFSYVSTKSLRFFLDDCQRDAKYVEGLDLLCQDRYKQAAESFDTWLQSTSKQDKQMLDASIYSALSHQMVSENEKAKTVLEAGIKNYKTADKLSWPVPIANFLLGKLSQEALLKEIDYDKFKEARVHYIIGMIKLREKDFDRAQENFELAHKNTYESSETYSLSESQLNLLDERTGVTK